MFRNLICLLLSYALVFQASFALEVNGELKNALGEKLASDPVTGLVEGRIYYNTTTKTLRVYDGTVWRNKVDTNSTQTLTNKTIDGNNNTLNVLAPTQLEGFVPIANGGTGQDTKAEAYDALSPNGSQGDLTYRGVSSNVALPIGANNQVLTVSSGYPSWQDSTGGAGSGEKNYVTNPSAATAITGWVCVGDLAVVRTTTAADLPRENTTPSGIKITATAGDQLADDDYCYFNFTLDDIDLNRKLNVKFATKQTGSYVSNDLAVVVTTQADRTTAVATPVVTNIAAADYDFNGNGFDTASTTTLSLVVRATADMATNAGVTISDVIVGPGTIVPQAPCGYIGSFTPAFTGVTVTVVKAVYSRCADRVKMDVEVTASADATTGVAFLHSGSISGITLDTSKYGLRAAIGSATGNLGSNSYTMTPKIDGSDVTFTLYNEAGSLNATLPAGDGGFDSGDRLSFTLEFYVSEWSGSANYAGQNDVEYAYNDDTTISDNSSAFAYGPSGVSIGSFTSNVTGNDTLKRVRFKTPIQVTDLVSVQVSRDGGITWNDFASQLPRSVLNTARYGMTITTVSTTDIDVRFGKAGAGSGNTAAHGDVNGDPWSNYTSFKWRAVKARAGAAVGFSIAGDDTSNGLTTKNITGTTQVTSLQTTALGASAAKVTLGGTDIAVTLPTAGTYLVMGIVHVDPTSASGEIIAKLYNSTDAADVSGSNRIYYLTAAETSVPIDLSAVVTVASSKTIQFFAWRDSGLLAAAAFSGSSASAKLTYIRLY